MENEVRRGRKKKEIDGIFAERLSGLLQALKSEKGIIQEDVAKATGITRQSLGKWANGENVPDILDLKKLAEYFDVSADYLLGLTDNKTTDTDLQAVCKYTGLSEEAVNNLTDYIKSAFFTKKLLIFDFQNDSDSLNDVDYYLIDVINALFESHFLSEIIPPLVDYLEVYAKNAKEPSIRASDFAKWNINQWFMRSLDNFVNFIYDDEKGSYKFANGGDLNVKHNPPEE